MTDYLVMAVQEHNVTLYHIAAEDERDAIDRVAATEPFTAYTATAIYGGGYLAVEYEKASKWIDLANIIMKQTKLTNPLLKIFQ